MSNRLIVEKNKGPENVRKQMAMYVKDVEKMY